MIPGTAGVGPLSSTNSKASADNYKEILQHFMLPSPDKLYADADFISRRILNLPRQPKPILGFK